MDKVDELSEQALRVLAVATVKIGPVLPYGDDEDTDAKFAKLVKDCTFCGLCASAHAMAKLITFETADGGTVCMMRRLTRPQPLRHHQPESC
jgi:hypothetical protein